MNIIYMKNKLVLRKHLLHLIFCCAIVLYSCGPYSLSGSSVPSHIKTLAIPLFEDQTSEFQIKEKLTDAVIEEITRDNTLKITTETQADAIVYGKIVSISDQASTYDENEQVESYRVYITIDVEVKDVKQAKNMWKERWRQWGEYTIDPTTDARQEGIEVAIKKIAEDILNKTVSGW